MFSPETSVLVAACLLSDTQAYPADLEIGRTSWSVTYSSSVTLKGVIRTAHRTASNILLSAQKKGDVQLP